MAVGVGVSVGVGVGDWFEYVYTYSGNGSLPSPQDRPESARHTVLEIVGTSVTVEQMLRFTDLHEETQTYVTDVETGQGNITMLFIAANLSVGDLIYTSPPLHLEGAVINETIIRKYLGDLVQINHWNMTSDQMGEVTSYDYSWYRKAGALVKASVYQRTPENTWTNIELQISDKIPELSQVLILPLFMIVTLLTALMYRRRG